MSDNIIQLNEDLIKHDLKDLVRSGVEETLNALLDKEADALVNAQKYERSSERQGYRSGHYKRNFQTTAGEVELNVPKLKGIPFETAIIERYRRRESSVEEALIEMYLAGVSMMLKAIHSQESREAAREKAVQIAEKLKEMKLSAAAKKLQESIEEPLTYMDFPTQHWSRIRTNNTIERLNREIKRRTKAIGAFPDGQSALMLVCARLRRVAGTQWGCKTLYEHGPPPQYGNGS